MSLRLPPLGAGLLALALLTACSPDYSAVRDWSIQARINVLPPASVRPPNSAVTAPAAPMAVAARGQEGATRALQEAAGAWLAMLAFVAEDGEPIDRTSRFEPLAELVAPLDAEAGRAVIALGETMAFAARRNWRAPELTLAVQRGDPDFQKIMAALSRLTSAAAPADAASAERRAAFADIAEGHAFLNRNSSRLSARETARMLRLKESEMRRLFESGAR
jgi:hypothetical protein